jgi:hypothetical protein
MVARKPFRFAKAAQFLRQHRGVICDNIQHMRESFRHAEIP